MSTLTRRISGSGPLSTFPGWLGANAWRILKTSLGLILVGAATYYGHRAVFLTVSTEAVVTTEPLQIAAPIDGYFETMLDPGQVLEKEAMLGKLVNPLADDTSVVELSAQLAETEGSLNAVLTELEGLDVLGG